MHRDRARTECRERYPEAMITVRRPFSFNILELESRIDVIGSRRK